MPIPNLQITNPEAIALIQKIKSGQIFTPLRQKIVTYRYYLLAVIIVLVLIIALLIGKKVAERNNVPIYTPPEIESVSPTTTTSIRSTYSGLKEEISNLNTDLPDPVIPVFDSNIDLTSSVNEY